MARPSPGTQRVIAILNLFAENFDEPLSLTDVIRALKINRSTCHSLLAELVAANYLYRTNDKLYLPGPALARLGKMADHHLSPLQIALPEMRILADEFDVVCSALFRERDDVVVRERMTSTSYLENFFPRGTRWPLRAPFGAVFLAWSTPEETEGWLSRMQPPPTAEERQRTKESIDAVRERGFQFVVRRVPDRSMDFGSDWLFIQDPNERPVAVSEDLNEDDLYDMTSMSSPVFDDQDRVAFILAMTGFSKPRTGLEIRKIGARLCGVCEQITRHFKPT